MLQAVAAPQVTQGVPKLVRLLPVVPSEVPNSVRDLKWSSDASEILSVDRAGQVPSPYPNPNPNPNPKPNPNPNPNLFVDRAGQMVP